MKRLMVCLMAIALGFGANAQTQAPITKQQTGSTAAQKQEGVVKVVKTDKSELKFTHDGKTFAVVANGKTQALKTGWEAKQPSLTLQAASLTDGGKAVLLTFTDAQKKQYQSKYSVEKQTVQAVTT